MLQSIFSPLSRSRNFSLFIFSQWFLKISICPFFFCGICVLPYYFPMFLRAKNFWEMPSRKAQCVERFLVHLWPLLGSFDYRRNLGHTYSATFSRLGPRGEDWGVVFGGQIRVIWGSIKRWPGKRKRTRPKQLRVDWESMFFFASFEIACLQWIYQTTGIQPC